MALTHTYCVIMAGGIGSRFWPVSRNARPKQFLDILGVGKTFIQLTYERLRKLVPEDHIYVVTSAAFEDLVKEQLPQLDSDRVLLEPLRRNTAPCIAYASYKIMKHDPLARVIVAPSDHLITQEDVFYSTAESALDFAATHDVLVTLGIKPTRPETGYGYIQANKAKGELVGGHICYPVKTFTEKPDAQMAQILIDSGEFYWNSGIFIWSVASIVQQLERLVPEVARLFKDLEEVYFTPWEKEIIQRVYEGCKKVSIDYAVMEKAPNCYVFPATFGWSDVGTWDSFFLYKNPDAQGNVAVGDPSMLENTENCLIVEKTPQKLVVLKDARDLMVIDTPQILLICPRQDAAFKQVLNTVAFQKEEYL